MNVHVWRRVGLLFCLLGLNVYAQTPLVSLADRIENSIRNADSRWQCIHGILNALPPLVPSQRPLLDMVCHRDTKLGKRVDVLVHVFHVDSGADAEKVLSPMREGKVASGWKIKPVSIGEEGYVGAFRRDEGFQIECRKGVFVVEVSTSSLPVATRFARLIEDQVATGK